MMTLPTTGLQSATAAPATATPATAPTATPSSSPDPSTIAQWYQSSPYSQKAPQTQPGLIQSQTQAPTVVPQSTTGSVAQVDPSQFNPATPVNATMVPGMGTATGYKAAQTTGTNWNVTNPQTVSGQVQGLIDSNSPLMQQAATRAAQEQNSKGLLNSSMAIGAGQSAVIGAALPIAAQDATTQANAANYNATVANTTGQFNTTATNAANQLNTQALNAQSSQNQAAVNQAAQVNTTQANALQSQMLQQRGTIAQANQAAQNVATEQTAQRGLQAQMSNQSAVVQQAAQVYDGAVKMAMANTTAQGQLQLQTIDAATRTNITNMQAKYNVQMQTSQSMASTYQGFIQQSAAIMSDQNMDEPAKKIALHNLGVIVNDSMQLQSAASGLNLGSLLDTSQFGVTGLAGKNAAPSGPAATGPSVGGVPTNGTDPNLQP